MSALRIPHRLLGAAVFSLLLAFALLQSGLAKVLPPFGSVPPWGFLALALLPATLPVFLPRRPPFAASPLPILLAYASAAAVAGAYPESYLDWTKLLKDWGLARGTPPDVLRFTALLLPFAAAFGWHALVLRDRVHARYSAKGVPDPEVREAVLLVDARAKRALGDALLFTGLLFAAFSVLRPVAAALPGSLGLRVALLLPVLAGVGLALVARAYLRRHRKRVDVAPGPAAGDR